MARNFRHHGSCLAANLALAVVMLLGSNAPGVAATAPPPPLSAPAVAPTGQQLGPTAQPPGCTSTQPGSDVAKKPPGSGEMSTSATGMMTEPGRHTLPCPAPKLK